MASRGPRRSHRLPVVQTSSDEDELMAGLPTSSTRGQRLTKAQLDPVRAREAAITDERGQRPTKAKPDPVRAREAAITDERGQRPTKAKSDPVRAREAAITDERSQRLTKTQPDPVRAYQAVTTDELSTHSRRAPSAPPHNPETVSPTMQDSDEDSDPEIRQAQREFHELRRQRKLASIQLKVQRERDLLGQIHGRLTESTRPESSMPESGSPHFRGEKRPRSDTTLTTYDRPPPKAVMESKYKGKNMREFTTFTTRLENHFRRYAEYFTTDTRKVGEGVSELSDSLLLRWAQHEKDVGETAVTWQGS